LPKEFLYKCSDCKEEFQVSKGTGFAKLNKSRIKYCPDCGDLLQGKYCRNCKNKIKRLFSLAAEAIYKNHSSFSTCPYCGGNVFLHYAH
jgi:DNA-directed RNA polymerase subunit RPC12/RpoP